jgi:hypothetical protein
MISSAVFREIAQVQEESGQMAIRLGRDNFFIASRFQVFGSSVVDPELFIPDPDSSSTSSGFKSGSRPYHMYLAKFFLF